MAFGPYTFGGTPHAAHAVLTQRMGRPAPSVRRPMHRSATASTLHGTPNCQSLPVAAMRYVRTTGTDTSVIAFCARKRREHVRPGRRTHGRPSDVMRHCSKLRVHCAVCYRHFTGTLAHHSAAQMSQVRRSPPAMQRQDRTAPRSRRNSTTASRRIHRKYERERSVRGNRNGHRRWQFAALRRKRVRVRLRTFAALCCCARSASCSRLNSAACVYESSSVNTARIQPTHARDTVSPEGKQALLQTESTAALARRTAALVESC